MITTTCTGTTGDSETSISATYFSTGSTAHIVQLRISIVRCTGRQAAGTSEYTHAIRDATTSTSDTHTSTPFIVEVTVGETTEDAHGIMEGHTAHVTMVTRKEVA